MRKSVLCLFSGGIDSTVMVKHYLDKGWDGTCLFIDYGQPRNIFERELKSVGDIGSKFNFIPILEPTLKLHCDGFFYPVRNAHLLTVAINLAYELKLSNVAIGLCHGEYLDTRPEFIDRFNFMQEYCLKKPIWVLAPFSNWSSERVIKYGLKIGAPLNLTTSCMDTPACGKCFKCRLRKKYGIDEKSSFITSEGTTLVEAK